MSPLQHLFPSILGESDCPSREQTVDARLGPIVQRKVYLPMGPVLQTAFQQGVEKGAVLVCTLFAVLGLAPCASGQTPQASSNEVQRDTSASGAIPANRADRWRQRRREKSEELRPPETGFLGKIDRQIVGTAVSVIPNQIALELPGLDERGVQPVLGTFGGGFNAGLKYEPPGMQGSNQLLSVEAVGSPSRYYGTEILLGRERGKTVAYAYGRYRHQPAETFFGLGAGSSLDDRSTFRLNQGLFGGLGGRSLGENMLIGGHVSYQFNRIGNGRGDGEQVSTRFGDTLSGTREGSNHVMVGAFFEYDSRDASETQPFGTRFAPTEHRLRSVSLDASQGFYLSTEVTHNLDTRSDRYGFTRFTLDAREFIPIDEGQFHGFSLRQFASFSRSGDGDIPFYRLQSIGGSRSLRGYESGRFRDRNVLLMNAEVRCQIWHHMDMALFTDVGHVFNEWEEIGEGGAHVSAGIGFRVQKDGRTLGRIDFARSKEGWSTVLDLGSLF